MSKYKQTIDTATAETWRRASHMTLFNETIPRIEIHHEDRTELPDGTGFSKYLGSLQHIMTDPTIEIPFVNPDTYEQTEQTFTAGEFALMAASVYIWLAEQAENTNA